MQAIASSSRTNIVRLVFGLTIGLGAALLFWQQLMLGRLLLPVFGSVPTVWLVSLVVFQTVLLGAYAFAHLSHAWPRWFALSSIVLLVIAAGAQHFLYPDMAALGSSTAIDAPSVIIALLGLSGFSLFVLSLISPMLQNIYAGLPQPDAKDPYFLYSASNFGSFAGLLVFPLLLEPLFGVRMSQTIWFWGAGLFVVLLNSCLAFSAKAAPVVDAVPSAIDEAKPHYLKWLFYSFMPCALSFGATSHLISDIAPLPLLSMVPLALYLLTFVLAFSRKDRFSDDLVVAQIFLIAFYVFREIFTNFKPSHLFDILIILAAFFLTAWRCHRELVKLRPSSRYLTAFYLTLALGGALGGIFNVFVVPFILPLPMEFMLFLLITLLPNWKDDVARLKMPQFKKLHILIFGLLAVTLVMLAVQNLNVAVARMVTPVALVVSLMLLTMLPSVLAVASAALIAVSLIVTPTPIALQRDFFGVKRVMDRTFDDGVVYRTLLHGTTSHGMQQRTPSVTTTPQLYYAPGSGLQDVVEVMQPHHVGIVGLGMGAIACIPPRSSDIRYFEIDPGVEALAKQYFTYLHDCPAEIVIGDARMTLASDRNYYDLLILDAFSSDAIPVHLLTEEMFKVYRERLDRNGVLLLHISNRYLNLRHVVAGAAKQLSWHGAIKDHVPERDAPNLTPNEYAVLSPDKQVIQALLDKGGWISVDEVSPLYWTDDHISIVPILNLGFGK